MTADRRESTQADAPPWSVHVLTLYPEHRKVPDALFKLGIVYDRLGDRETAERHLQRAIGDHPGTTAAQLATEYLRERS